MTSTAEHQAIRELLPDYALGALPDADLDAVSEHLAICTECAAELDAVLEVGALIDLAPGPDPAVRNRVLASVASGGPADVPPRVIPVSTPEHLASGRPASTKVARFPTATARWLAAVAAVLLLALGWWNLQLQRELSSLAPIETVRDAAAIVSLNETQLTPRPTGTLFVSGAGDAAVLTAAGLPAPPAGASYQVWLFGPDGTRSRLTEFTPDANGNAVVSLTPPQPMFTFAAIAISVGISGETAPSGPLALGAWFSSSTPTSGGD